MAHAPRRSTIPSTLSRRLAASTALSPAVASLLVDLPADVDPCGENGEFHSFCFAGPMFHKPIDVIIGEMVDRDGFVFADVLPSGGPA